LANVNFGLHLDGQHGRHPSNQLGHQTVGPLGFLTTLETQLGLLRDHPSQSERIVQYRNCLERCDHPDRFYHRSFATDELGTAATLLGWRDLWHLHGWSGELDQAVSSRLGDMGDVEQLAMEGVAPSMGQRLALVLGAMQARRPAIDEVVLSDPLAAFPFRWREVLARLPVRDESSLTAPGVGLLGELQDRLLRAHGGEPTEPLAWRDDGSLTVVQAETCFLSGRWLANQLAGPATESLIVAGADAALFDGLLVMRQIAELNNWMTQRWPDARRHAEVPVEAMLDNGQVMQGRIDLLLETQGGWILLDHKSNPQGPEKWPEIAHEYSGQLVAYGNAVAQATGKPVLESWLFFPVSAGAVRIALR